MRHDGRSIAGLLAISLLLAGAGSGVAVPATSRWAVCGEWRRVTTHGAEGWAYDVAVVSPQGAWIVGYQGGDDSYVPLALHWSGLRWERETIPLARGVSAGLRGVSVVAPDEVWAVGFKQVWKQGFGNLPTRPFAARWDGRRWSPVPVKIDGLHGWLEAVVGAHGRIWAVGRDWTPKTNVERTLTLRWSGSAWHRVPSPSPGALSRLRDVTLTGGRLWALGGWSDARHDHALAVRWTGARWQRVDVPVAGELYAGTPAGVRRLWAVGTSRRGPVVVRWDGARWHVRHPFRGRKVLQDVLAPSPGTVWVVGRRAEGKTGSTERPFVARAVRGAWRSEPTPARRGSFAAIAGTPNDLWIAHVKPAAHDPFTYTNAFHRC
ncbi:MAG: hypothetical protein ACM3OO_13050 [Planctomycetaceae bacterium]